MTPWCRGAAALLLVSLPTARAEEPAPPPSPADPLAPAAPPRATPEEIRALLAKADENVITITEDAPDPNRIAGAAHYVDERQLEQAEYDDVHRILGQVPGVYVRTEDGFGLRPNIGLRGASADRSAKVTLTEDGILLAPAPYSAPAAYYFPLVTTMVGLEVFKGPAAIRYGPQTIGGAVNLVTAPVPVDGPLGLFDIELGGFGYRKAHVRAGTGGPDRGILVEGIHVESTGFKVLDGGGDTGFSKDEVRLKGRLATDLRALPGRRTVELKLGYSSELSNETYLGLTDADFALTPNRRYAASQLDQMSWWRTQVEASHTMADTGRYAFEVTAYRHDFDRSWRKVNGFVEGPELFDLLTHPAGGASEIYLAILRGEEDSLSADEALRIGTNQRRYVSEGLQATWWQERDRFLAGRSEIGLRLHHDYIERLHTEDPHLMVAGVLTPIGDDDTVVTTQNRGEAFALAAYAEDRIPVRRFVVIPGVRTELIRTSLTDHLTGDVVARFSPVVLPGLGALWQPTARLTALAGVYRGFSAVSPGQAPEVKPESSVNWEAGLRWTGARSTRAEAVGFFNDYSNLTSECTLSRGCDEDAVGTQTNAGAVDVYGVESAFGQGATFGWGSLDAGLAYTFTWSAFKTAFTSSDISLGEVEVGDQLPYVPVHQLSARAGASAERWGVQASLAHASAMRDVAGQGEILDGEGTEPYWVVDVNAHHAVGRRAQLYLKVDNLTNAAWIASRRPYGARPGKPQMLMVGWKQSF